MTCRDLVEIHAGLFTDGPIDAHARELARLDLLANPPPSKPKLTTRDFARVEMSATCRRLSVVTEELGYLAPRCGEPLRSLIEQLAGRIETARGDAANLLKNLAAGDYAGAVHETAADAFAAAAE